MPGVNHADPLWQASIREIAAQQLGGRYAVAKHNRSRCWLDLVLTQADDAAPVDEEISRAEQVIAGLFGESVRPEVKRNDEGVHEALVRYGFNPRIAENPRLRSRIEKVFGSSLPGRWRAEWDLVRDEVRFEIRPTIPPAVIPHPPAPKPVSGSARDTYSSFDVPYGVDEDGNTMSWMPVRNPHMLVVARRDRARPS